MNPGKMINIVMVLIGALLLVSSCSNLKEEQRREKNINTVKTFLGLLEEEKIVEFVDLFFSDGKQINPYSSGLFPGEISGKEALLNFWKPVPGRFDGMKFPIKTIHPMKDPNLILVEFQGRIKLKGGAGYYENDY